MPDACPTPAISTRALTRQFNTVLAIANVDLQVRAGEMFGLVGPDGAGKSTLIRLLCGLLRPSSGSGTILGLDLVADTARIKPRIGYLSQNFTLYGDLTVDENIEFFADIHGVPDFHPLRTHLLEITGLLPFRTRFAQNLSGGMKKKLALACTLIHKPDLIFLDEPSTGVDPVSRGEFWNLLSQMMANGMTVFLTTPYLDEAERCDRVALINQGRILVTDSPDKIRSAMKGRVFHISCPSPLQAYGILRQTRSPSQLSLQADQLRLSVEPGQPSIEQSVAILQKANITPVASMPAEPSLEDAFISLVSTTTTKGVHP